MRKVILASASTWRRDILEKTHLPFTVEASDFEEDLTLNMSPEELVETLATGKAETVAVKHADAIVIGADTIAELNGEILGKPYTSEKAIEVLSRLSGQTHNVLTGYCIIDTKTGERRGGVSISRVTFRTLTRAEIDAYVATGEPLNAGGSYTIQTGAASFVSHIDGDYWSIVGLPVSTIVEELAKLGITAQS